MLRTPEQVAADDALTAAIEQVALAYSDDGQAWVTAEYMVLASQHRYDDDGDGVAGVGVFYRDDDVPIHRALGLIEFAAARLRKVIQTDDDDDQ